MKPSGLYTVLVSRAERVLLADYLNRQGVRVVQKSNNEKICAAVAQYLSKPMPDTVAGKAAMVRGMIERVKEDQHRRIKDNRYIPKFTPLKTPLAMRIAIARAHELHGFESKEYAK